MIGRHQTFAKLSLLLSNATAVYLGNEFWQQLEYRRKEGSLFSFPFQSRLGWTSTQTKPIGLHHFTSFALPQQALCAIPLLLPIQQKHISDNMAEFQIAITQSVLLFCSFPLTHQSKHYPKES